MHIFAARYDRETGKGPEHRAAGLAEDPRPATRRLQPRPRWSCSQHPARAWADQPGHRVYIDAANLRAGLEVEDDPRELIRDYLVQRVEHGVVPDRADINDALKEA